MKLVTFQKGNEAPQAGALSGDRVVALGDSMINVIANNARAKSDAPSYALSEVKLLAPIPRPPKLICVGLNYRDHAAEARQEIPKVPTIFAKFSNVVIGPDQPIVLPRNSRKPDYEAEFAFVIGAGGRHIPSYEWQQHVFGYTAFNDVSARDFQMATSQWMIGKTFDTFAPMGPYLVSADEIAEGFRLTGFFLARDLFALHGEPLPDSRAAFLKAVAQGAR